MAGYSYFLYILTNIKVVKTNSIKCRVYCWCEVKRLIQLRSSKSYLEGDCFQRVKYILKHNMYIILYIFQPSEAKKSKREIILAQNVTKCWFIKLEELVKMEGAEYVFFSHPNTIVQWATQILNSFTFRKLEGLGEEGSGILAKMEGAETSDIAEQNQILMMLLKASCEVI